MKVKSVRLNRFKRFTDLTITDLPPTARLVVLVGPNGSGKSSLFDAFNWISKHYARSGQLFIGDYHVKQDGGLITNGHDLQSKPLVEFHDKLGLFEHYGKSTDATSFYIRSGYRFEAEFSIRSFQKKGDVLADENRPNLLINLDTRVADNYERIVGKALADLFEVGEANNLTRVELRDQLIGEVRESLQKVLPTVRACWGLWAGLKETSQ